MNTKNAEINALTKESISVAAANTLIDNMPLSITTICKRAGVSRNAFYRNFGNIDDIFIYYMAMKWAEYSKSNHVEETQQDRIVNHLIRFFYSQKLFVEALKKHDLTHLVEKLFVNVVVPPQVNGGLRYTLYGTSYFVYGIIRAMIDNDFADTPEEIEGMFKA